MSLNLLPAYEAGVRANDIITKVCFSSSQNLSLDRLNHIFSGKVGKKIKIKVMRRKDAAIYFQASRIVVNVTKCIVFPTFAKKKHAQPFSQPNFFFSLQVHV